MSSIPSITPVTSFNETLQEMREHYKSNVGKFALASKLESQIPGSSRQLSVDNLPADAAAINKDFKQKVNTFTSDQQSVVTNETDHFMKNKDSNEFSQRCEEAKKKAKEDADARIDTYYNQLKEAGQGKTPEEQNAMLYVANEVTNFLINTVFGNISHFVIQLVKKISEWLEHAFDEVKHFFSNTFGEVEDFFAKIF